MFSTILVPTDGTSSVDAPLKAALELARQSGGKIIALTVASALPLDPSASSMPAGEWERYEAYLRGEAGKNLVAVTDAAHEAGVPCETVIEQGDEPAEKILQVAQLRDCDAIFMASHRQGALMKLFAGSVTQRVLTHATVPVMVFR